MTHPDHRRLTLAAGAWLLVSPVAAQTAPDAVPDPTQPSAANAGGDPPPTSDAVRRPEAESDPSPRTETRRASRLKFDAGVSVSPLFTAYLDVPSCCHPLGVWWTVGSGRWRLQLDYLRNQRKRSSSRTYYEAHMDREIQVERAYLETNVEQIAGVTAHWLLSRNRRWTPYLLFDIALKHLSARPCVAQGNPVVGTPDSGQRFQVDFENERPCADKRSSTRFGIGPQVGLGLDTSIGSRFFVRAQIRLFEVRMGAGVRG